MRIIIAACVMLLSAVGSAVADEQAAETHSRARYVHRLTLYDETGRAIDPRDPSPRPYSPRATCGKCHDYATISGGWHFNAFDAAAPPGRTGEPFLLLDRLTRTQLPVSPRPGPGQVAPSAVELTPWQFLDRFASHLPGGGPGEKFSELAADPHADWTSAGRLEIDCMICHGVAANYDLDERAVQVARRNYRWAPTAALGLASIRGKADSGSAAPAGQIDLSQFDPAGGDAAPASSVLVVYDKSRFDADDRVFLDITRRPAAERCYACHGSRAVGESAGPDWMSDDDVHLRAGLVCTDCHRNGIDHNIARGYPSESAQRGQPALAALSCQGCHLGDDSPAAATQPDRLGGKLGAPRPAHAGLPDLHLNKLSCTACHSGPWPTGRLDRVQTAQSHKLGLLRTERPDDEPPAIAEPVFIRRADGQIAPHRAVWPAFWARRDAAGQLTPIAPRQVAAVAADILAVDDKTVDWPTLNEPQIAAVLRKLAEGADPRSAEPVYVAGGRLHRMAGDGVEVVPVSTPTAAMHAWPIAHDVRPAEQSLGAGGCIDCHSAGSAFFHTAVADPLPPPVGDPAVVPMYTLEQVDPKVMAAWATSFVFRPIFIWTGLAATIGLGGLLLLHVAPALRGGPRFWRGLLIFGVLAMLAALGGSGFYAAAVGRPLSGWLMMAHSMVGAAFSVALVLLTLAVARVAHPAGRGLAAAFWLMVAFGFATVLAIMLSMLKSTPAAAQQTLYAVHLYASVGLVACAVVTVILWLASRKKRESSE